MVKTTAVIALLLLAGCGTPAPAIDAKAVWCGQNEPRRDAGLDTPRWELDQINEHNRKGKLWCGWHR